MANPFFSGRIPPGLADKIDAHLLQTGETRSELLIRLLLTEVNDNIIDNKVLDLIARVEKLEQLVNNKTDNEPDKDSDNTIDNEPLQLSDEDWIDLNMIAVQLGVEPRYV